MRSATTHNGIADWARLHREDRSVKVTSVVVNTALHIAVITTVLQLSL